MKKRYNLNIQTTSVGGTVPATPAKPKASLSKVTKRTPKIRKKATKSPAQVAKIEKQLGDEEDEDELADGINGSGNVKSEDDTEEMVGSELAALGLYHVNHFGWLTRS